MQIEQHNIAMTTDNYCLSRHHSRYLRLHYLSLPHKDPQKPICSANPLSIVFLVPWTRTRIIGHWRLFALVSSFILFIYSSVFWFWLRVLAWLTWTHRHQLVSPRVTLLSCLYRVCWTVNCVQQPLVASDVPGVARSQSFAADTPAVHNPYWRPSDSQGFSPSYFVLTITIIIIISTDGKVCVLDFLPGGGEICSASGGADWRVQVRLRFIRRTTRPLAFSSFSVYF